jgi:hypothetical protein
MAKIIRGFAPGGTSLGASGDKIGFFGSVTTKPAALTSGLTALTHHAPGTPDYAVQQLTNSSPYGFVTADEGETVLKVVANLQTRVGELETKLKALGLLS